MSAKEKSTTGAGGKPQEVALPIARYTRTAVILHWLIALFVIANVLLAWTWDSVSRGQHGQMVDVHKSIGLTVFGLALLRMLWRYSHSVPAYPASYQRWERLLSNLVHGLLYLVMLMMPITGYLMVSAGHGAAPVPPVVWFRLFPIPPLGLISALSPATRHEFHELFELSHTLFAYALYGLVFLHVAGALKHQFIDHEKELQRMM